MRPGTTFLACAICFVIHLGFNFFLNGIRRVIFQIYLQFSQEIMDIVSLRYILRLLQVNYKESTF